MTSIVLRLFFIDEEKSVDSPPRRKEKRPQRAVVKSPTVVRMHRESLRPFAPLRGGLLETVSWSAVFQTGLFIVVRFTQRLPVATIPEQIPVSTVRYDVVNDRCFHVPSLRQALNTQRMGSEELLAGLLPCTTVPTAGRASRFLWMEGAVLITVLPTGYQLRTAGMRTGALRSERHGIQSPQIMLANNRVLWYYAGEGRDRNVCYRSNLRPHAYDD